MEYLISAIIAVAINAIVFVVAYLRQTDKLTDITYALTFVCVAAAGFLMGGYSTVSVCVTLLVGLWALRLGIFLGIRIHRIGRDRRFDAWRPSFWKFGRFWLLQGASVWVIMLPISILLAEAPAKYNRWSSLGLILWVAGLLIEAMADNQKSIFLANPANKGKWIESGLWSWSRHPNYFGEILVWLGVYLFALPYFTVWQAAISLVGPLWITAILLFVSGVPPAEKSSDAKWGENPAYQRYKRRVPILVPKLHR